MKKEMQQQKKWKQLKQDWIRIPHVNIIWIPNAECEPDLTHETLYRMRTETFNSICKFYYLSLDVMLRDCPNSATSIHELCLVLRFSSTSMGMSGNIRQSPWTDAFKKQILFLIQDNPLKRTSDISWYVYFSTYMCFPWNDNSGASFL